tara:strand:+ start:328 stop:714 length:387 start_codon:yes stop_codon:yes gene_type:complete
LRLLLDTHILLWALVDDPRLPARARALIADPENPVWISAACIWEIAIKHSLGRGHMPLSGDLAMAFCREAGYEFLPVAPAHAAATEQLAPLHSDPFDRLLVAQAMTESMHLLTHDEMIGRYDAPIIKV